MLTAVNAIASLKMNKMEKAEQKNLLYTGELTRNTTAINIIIKLTST